MSKTNKKTPAASPAVKAAFGGKRGATTPFTVRAAKRCKAALALGERLQKHAAKETDAKLLSLSDALTVAARAMGEWIAKQPADFKPAGSPTSSAARSWEVGDECKLVAEYAFLFPTLKTDKSYKVKEVKKMGEGRGSKTFLILENGTAGQASNFEKA